MKIIILCLSTLIGLSLTGVAQTRIGYVLNRQGEPVDFATVIFLDKDSPIRVGITDSLGYFSLDVANGSYTFKIQALGYNVVEKELTLTSEYVELGEIRMEDNALALGTVVVEGSTIIRAADRFIIQVNETNPTMLNKDGAALLQLSPGVWVDDEGVSINGSSGTKVFINDREIKQTSSELVDYLRNYSSSDIERIEVIPQAGAEYSADSKSGVIKIYLKQQTEKGINGNVMLSSVQANGLEQYKPATTINVLAGKLSWNLMMSGYRTVHNKQAIEETRDFYSNENEYLQSQGKSNANSSLYMGRLGTIYNMNKRHTFGAEIEFWTRDTKSPSRTNTSGFISGIALSGSEYSEQNECNYNMSTTVNYIYKVDTLGSLFKCIVDYTDKKVENRNNYYSAYEAPYSSDSTHRNKSDIDYGIYTIDIAFNKVFKNKMKLTAGSRYVRNKMNNKPVFETLKQTQWIPVDADYSLNYTENIAGVYGTFAMKIGNLDVLTGIRTEYLHTVGKNEFDKTTVDLFPSATFTYAFNTMRTLMLIAQYSRNIQRPNFWHLNPNKIQYSDYSYMIGNPQLRPTYIHRIMLTAVYKYAYTLTVGSNMHRDLIREITRIDQADSNIKYIIPENHYREDHHFIAINCPLTLTDWLKLNSDFVGVKQDIQASKSSKKQNHYLYFLKMMASITLPSQFYLELSTNWTSRLYSANSGIVARQTYTVAIKKHFSDNRWNISLNLDNIFNRKASYFSNTENYHAYTSMKGGWDSRFLKVSAQYNFKLGKTFNKQKIESTTTEVNKRMEKVED